MDESILVFSRVSFWKLSTFHGYKDIYSSVCEECERSFFYKTGHSGAWPRDSSQPWDNWLARLLFLSCSAPAVITLQLSACFKRVAFWWIASRQDPVLRNFQMHTFLNFFTLSHTQLLHYSHLNIGYLIAKLQANLAWNKANTWLNKFNLTP